VIGTAGACTTLKKSLATASCRGRQLVRSPVDLRKCPRCFAILSVLSILVLTSVGAFATERAAEPDANRQEMLQLGRSNPGQAAVFFHPEDIERGMVIWRPPDHRFVRFSPLAMNDDKMIAASVESR
jgi:hypothetical protein